jgi:hypothetical protein
MSERELREYARATSVSIDHPMAICRIGWIGSVVDAGQVGMGQHAKTSSRLTVVSGGVGQLSGVALECRDPAALAEFYSRLTGWPVVTRRRLVLPAVRGGEKTRQRPKGSARGVP